MIEIPQVVSWNLTRRCNLRCAHCYLDAAALSSPAPDELTPEESLRFVDDLAALAPGAMLILSGGEPLLRPDLTALARRASERGLMPVLGTNGTALTRQQAADLKAAGLIGVGISIDSTRPPAHDAFRGVPGAWGAAMRGLRCAQEAGLEAQIQLTLSPANVGEFDDVVRLCRDQDVRVLTVFFLVCTGRGQGLVDLTPEGYEAALGVLVDQATRPGPVMVRPRCAPTFRRILHQRIPGSLLLASDAARCLAGRTYCRITPEGDVTPCPYIPTVVGNVRRRPFSEIWRTAPALLQFRRPSLDGACGRCEYREICGGCRARALALKGDLMAEDPWCVHEPDGAHPVIRDRGSAPDGVVWEAEAEAILERIPRFVREVVRRSVEALAAGDGLSRVTPDLLRAARTRMKRP